MGEADVSGVRGEKVGPYETHIVLEQPTYLQFNQKGKLLHHQLALAHYLSIFPLNALAVLYVGACVKCFCWQMLGMEHTRGVIHWASSIVDPHTPRVSVTLKTTIGPGTSCEVRISVAVKTTAWRFPV